MIGEVFTWIDACCAETLPQGARLAIWAAFSGAASMWLYAISSPQRKLAELKAQTVELGQRLAVYDGDFAGAMALSQQNLMLSLKRLGWALGPSLLAGLPVIVVLVGLATPFDGEQFFTFGPDWFRSWLCGFFAISALSALATKFIFRIN